MCQIYCLNFIDAKDRPLNENKLLASAKLKRYSLAHTITSNFIAGSFAQYQARCRLCNAQVTQRHGTYCQGKTHIC